MTSLPPATGEVASPLGTGASSEGDRLVVSVVIPCLNEAENIEECVTRAFAVLREHGMLNQSFPGALSALHSGRTVAGIAYTVNAHCVR